MIIKYSLALGILLLFNFYLMLYSFPFFSSENLYIDVVCILILLFFCAADIIKYLKVQKVKEEALKKEIFAYPVTKPYLDMDIYEHDRRLYESYIAQEREKRMEMEDYAANWVHEVKIPLSILFIMAQNNQDYESQDQLERIQSSLNNILAVSKMQSDLIDFQFKQCGLKSVVQKSVKNNQYFLIRHHFELELKNLDWEIYTDPLWLTYILDQVIANADKYRKEDPFLKIEAYKENDCILCKVADHGLGIASEDLPRIFDKGYVGRSSQAGEYKSTGMGLYFVKNIAKNLNIKIDVSSNKKETVFYFWIPARITME